MPPRRTSSTKSMILLTDKAVDTEVLAPAKSWTFKMFDDSKYGKPGDWARYEGFYALEIGMPRRNMEGEVREHPSPRYSGQVLFITEGEEFEVGSCELVRIAKCVVAEDILS